MKKKTSKRQSKHIREGMKVMAVCGNDKGRTGTVLSRTDSHVVVQGLNVRKKHQKRRSQEEMGGIINIEMPIHVSNVSVVDADDNAIKLRVKQEPEGRTLVYTQGGEEKVFRSVKKSK